MKTKPFYHSAIISILQDRFFTTEQGECLAAKHTDCFKSSIQEHPDELEVTAPMTTFAATCVQHLWDLSLRTMTDFASLDSCDVITDMF